MKKINKIPNLLLTTDYKSLQLKLFENSKILSLYWRYCSVKTRIFAIWGSINNRVIGIPLLTVTNTIL